MVAAMNAEDSIQSLPPVRIETCRDDGGVSLRAGLAIWAALLAPLQTATAQAIPDSTMVVHFIDVGQGAAALLEFSCGAIMMDAGGQASSDVEGLTQYLGRFFDRRCDLGFDESSGGAGRAPKRVMVADGIED
jgi:beta-lactamase superfamily II metal-dependent hydrolase